MPPDEEVNGNEDEKPSDASGPLLSTDDLSNLAELAGELDDEEDEDDKEAEDEDEEESGDDAEDEDEANDSEDEESEDEEQELDPQADHRSLQAKVDAGEPLTTEEKQRLRGYEQADADRASARRQAREQARQREENLKKAREGLPEKILGNFTAEIDAARAEERKLSSTLLKNTLTNTINEAFTELKPLVMYEEDASVRGAVYEILGESQRAEEMAGPDVPFMSVVENLLGLVYESGKASATDAGEVGRLKRRVAELEAAQLTESGEKAKKVAPGSKNAKASTPKRSITGEEDLDALRKAEAEGDLEFVVN